MRVWKALVAGSSQGRGLPLEIYASLVDALYKDFRSLFIGSIAAAGTALITAIKAGEPYLYLCSIAIVLVACLRAVDAKAFANRTPAPMDLEEAQIWEMRYAVGSAAHVALLGVWCLIAFAMTNDPFVHIFSFSLTIAYMIGISGRNFASNFLVTTQITAAGLPMTAALLTMGGFYYAVFALVVVPFFITLKFISDRLRRVLLDAVIASRELGVIANRFDTALNNMPHGLCMFDAAGKLTVANRRISELLNISAEEASRHPTLPELLAAVLLGGALSTSEAHRLRVEMEKRLAGATTDGFAIDTVDGRIIELAFNRMSGGGTVVVFEDVTARREAENKINQLARYDSVTSLPNRAHFREHMDEALSLLRRRGPFGIHFVDLDQFKAVNDTLGHPVGDKLLCEVAQRLRELSRDTDVISRFGSDEFVILQFPLGLQKEAGALAERIVQRLSEPFMIDGNKIVIGASVGISLAPRDGTDADVLLKNADMALARAKTDGRSAFRFFEQGMDVKAQARRVLQLDLRQALVNDEFQVFYQPLVNLHTGRISTCEALLRWPHPQRGMVSPAEFIPVAEEMGLISELGNMVLEKACHECAGWPTDVKVAVNVSAVQFQRGQLTNVVRGALERSGLSPHRLEIEITESIFLNDSNLTRQWFSELQEMGVRISLDDFGTGYSSLSYFHSYPLNKVKIDRSFLQDVETSARTLNLLHGVARLSAELGMAVVIEGVETEEQLALVQREPSIHEVQGWLFGKAMPPEAIRQMLAGPQPYAGRAAA